MLKHCKRDHNSLNVDKLSAFPSSLYDSLLLAWLNTSQWASFRETTEQLARALDFYDGYLRSQNKKMKTHHLSEAIPIADKTSVELLPVNLTPSKSLTSLSDAVSTKGVYEQIFVGDYIPSDSREKYRCIQDLRRGLRRPCVLCTCSVGGPVGNYLFIWPIQDHVTLEAALNENQKIISQIQSDVPVYHRRTLRKKLISKFGRISPKTS